MGAYSTMDIERDDAVEVLKKALDSGALSNEEISDMLFSAFGERTLHNFRITCCPEGPWMYTPGALVAD